MPVFLLSLPWWVKSLPTFVGVLIEIAKFLLSLRDKGEAKSCAVALEDARKTGDTSKLEDLIKKMKAGDSCAD